MATKTSKSSDYAILVKDLHKSYQTHEVLKGVNFGVKRGTVMALLGPNGAGKTTAIRILSTLLRPDRGEATINGYNIATQAQGARSSIGLTGQYSAVDEYLTGKENLYMIGRLYRLSVEEARRRTDELLEQFDLLEASTRPVKTYSGGMKRRLDLAMSLIASPPIIFLDEPTTGLDPRSRMAMWDMIKRLVGQGTTVLLTTQYMDEADQLANNIVVIDDGRVIAEGTPDSLKSKVGSDRLEIAIAKTSSLEKATKAVGNDGHDNLTVDNDTRTISIATNPKMGGIKELKHVLALLEKANVEVDSVELRRPTLDDVFLSLTGHATLKEDDETDPRKRGKKQKGGK